MHFHPLHERAFIIPSKNERHLKKKLDKKKLLDFYIVLIFLIQASFVIGWPNFSLNRIRISDMYFLQVGCLLGAGFVAKCPKQDPRRERSQQAKGGSP